MIYLEFQTTNGNIVRIPAKEIAEKLGLELHPTGAVSLVCRDDEHGDELIATSYNWSGEYSYPGIDLRQNINGTSGLISATELPNEDNFQVMTFLYAGNDETETDDWIACIADGVREDGDESRRMMFVDSDLTCVGSARQMPGDPIPYTEKQYDSRKHLN